MTSPILHYVFDNADLTIDSSSSGLNLTNVGATSVTDAERGLVASLNGSSKLILPSGSVPTSLLGSNPRTYTFWVNHQHTNDQGFFFSNGTDATETRIRLRISGGRLIPDLSDNSNGGGLVLTPSGEWHHMAVTYVGSTLKTYVDGVLDLTWSVSTNIGVDELVIGAESENNAFYTGLLSDVRIYDTVLSETEITTEMIGNVSETASETASETGTVTLNPTLQYTFDNIDVTIDSSSLGLNLTNSGGVTSVTDSERGLVASFDGSSTLIIPSASVPPPLVGSDPRTITLWVKLNDTITPDYIFTNGPNTEGNRWQLFHISNTFGLTGWASTVSSEATIQTDIWYHIACTYNNSASELYINGVSQGISTQAIDTTVADFIIGSHPTNTTSRLDGCLSNFHIYNTVLSEADIVTEMNGGIIFTEPETETDPIIPNDMVGVPGVFFMDLTWTPIVEAIKYKIEFLGTDGSNGISIIEENSVNIGSLNPNIEYVFTLYSTDGAVFVEYGTPLTINTLEDVIVNYDITIFENSDNVTDLSSLETIELEYIDEKLNELLNTGDTVAREVLSSSINTTFINRGDTLDSSSSNGVGGFLIPFTQTSGLGQEVTISSGTEDIEISYDESNDQVIVGGVYYSNGDSLVIDGKRMTVHNV